MGTGERLVLKLIEWIYWTAKSSAIVSEGLTVRWREERFGVGNRNQTRGGAACVLFYINEEQRARCEEDTDHSLTPTIVLPMAPTLTGTYL